MEFDLWSVLIRALLHIALAQPLPWFTFAFSHGLPGLAKVVSLSSVLKFKIS